MSVVDTFLQFIKIVNVCIEKNFKKVFVCVFKKPVGNIKKIIFYLNCYINTIYLVLYVILINLDSFLKISIIKIAQN